MTELSESIYFRSDDRQPGIDWLENNELSGYVLEPRGQWVQVFPDWEHLSDEKTLKALKNSTETLVYYYFAEERFWCLGIYRNGEPLFQYDCIWMVDQYETAGVSVQELASTFDVEADELAPLLPTDNHQSAWDDHADNAAELAYLLGLPNSAYASFAYASEESPALDEFLVGPDAPTADSSSAESESPQNAPGPIVEPDGNAPWQAVYDLASHFLKNLHDQELIELKLDSRLVRDRLIERLTNTVIENPVSRDSQVISHWLKELMTCPEIVDVYATDEMIEDAYQRAKLEVADPVE